MNNTVTFVLWGDNIILNKDFVRVTSLYEFHKKSNHISRKINIIFEWLLKEVDISNKVNNDIPRIMYYNEDIFEEENNKEKTKIIKKLIKCVTLRLYVVNMLLFLSQCYEDKNSISDNELPNLNKLIFTHGEKLSVGRCMINFCLFELLIRWLKIDVRFTFKEHNSFFEYHKHISNILKIHLTCCRGTVSLSSSLSLSLFLTRNKKKFLKRRLKVINNIKRKIIKQEEYMLSTKLRHYNMLSYFFTQRNMNNNNPLLGQITYLRFI